MCGYAAPKFSKTELCLLSYQTLALAYHDSLPALRWHIDAFRLIERQKSIVVHSGRLGQVLD